MARPGALRTAVLLAALAGLAVGLRAARLGWPALWVDEAESAVNALTILESGLPRYAYRGLPLFENALVRPWPQSREYAFRDLSYSDRGLAVYHGWLPLYAIAAAFRLAGVTPAQARLGPPARDASRAELVRWTAVPRWPGLAFSALLVFAAWGLGRAAGGPGAGWALALACAGAGFLVWTGRQARYYSPALALSAACGLAVWNALRRGRARDHAAAGLALGLLFHTHALGAVVLGALYALSLPFAPPPARRRPRLALAAGVAGVLILPWAWWSGLLQSRAWSVPAGRELLGGALLVRSLEAPALLAAAAVALAAALLERRVRARLPQRLARPAASSAWTLLAAAAFAALVPAPSYFPSRMKLLLAVPGLLLAALLLTAACKALWRTRGTAAPAAAMALVLLVTGQLPPELPPAGEEPGEHEAARVLRGLRLSPGGRVYAMPNMHLTLTYYSGVPVQSVSAVRRSWLDAYRGELVVVEGPWYEPLPASEVQAVARRHRLEPSEPQARAMGRRALRLATVEALGARVPAVHPPPRPLEPLERELVLATRRHTRRFMTRTMAGTPFAADAAEAQTWPPLWSAYFLRFAEPAARAATAPDWGRQHAAEAFVLEGGWILYDCRRERPAPLLDAGALS